MKLIKFLFFNGIILLMGFNLFAGEFPMDKFAESGELPAEEFHLWDLASAKPKNLSRIFDLSTVPNLTDFRGNKFNGIILDITKFELGNIAYIVYTGKLRDILTGKAYSQKLTFQKRFYQSDNEKGESGINYWPVKEIESMPIKIYISSAIGDSSGDSMKIDYNLKSNKWLVERPLLDEIRQIPGSDLYIGKMYYRVAGKLPVFFLWFALEKRR